MKARKWVLVRQFDGFPKDGDLEIQEEDLPELQDGDVVLEGICWSVDPYMRLMVGMLSPGDSMVGTQLGRIIQSKNEDFPVGKLLLCESGWRSHTVLNPATTKSTSYLGFDVPYVTIPADIPDVSKSLSLGALGMPGATAYFGFPGMCKPKPGETVLVNGAAGAVGSLVGQIAKIKGCKVVGFAGSDAKIKYLKEDLGFDFAYNYKKIDVSEALKEAAPEGIDCYFDNVGGDFTTKVVMNHMKSLGRIAICGSISTYNDTSSPALAPLVYPTILLKRLQISGLIGFGWVDKYQEAFTQIAQWIKEDKIKCKEHVTEGFDNMFTAFRGLFKGDNIGKAVVNAVVNSSDKELTKL